MGFSFVKLKDIIGQMCQPLFTMASSIAATMQCKELGQKISHSRSRRSKLMVHVLGDSDSVQQKKLCFYR